MDEEALFRFRVQGTQSTQMALSTKLYPFDETYEVEGEHPAHALVRLMDEIEWGILDADYEFTVTFVPAEDSESVEVS